MCSPQSPAHSTHARAPSPQGCAAGADTRVLQQDGAAQGEGGAEGAVEAEVDGGGAADPLALTDAESAEKVRCELVGLCVRCWPIWLKVRCTRMHRTVGRRKRLVFVITPCIVSLPGARLAARRGNWR